MAVKDELRQELEKDILGREEVKAHDMMGTTAYMVRGRMFAFWVADGLVAKLPDRVRREFFDRQEGVEFQGPQGRGQGDWTRLPIEKKKDVAVAKVGVKEAYEWVRGASGGKQRGKKAKR